MASTTYAAGTGASSSDIGGSIVWSNPGNITSSNNVYATAAITQFNSSQALKATNFNISLPTNTTIDGLVFSFERKASSANVIRDTHVYVLKNGTYSGNNKSTSATWSTTEGTVSFGGPADLWGNTLTRSDVENTNFGVLIACTNYSAYAGTHTASIDYIELTLYYTINFLCAWGSEGIDNIYWGSQQISRVYHGTVRVA